MHRSADANSLRSGKMTSKIPVTPPRARKMKVSNSKIGNIDTKTETDNKDNKKSDKLTSCKSHSVTPCKLISEDNSLGKRSALIIICYN